ncbi:MAG: glycosyl transferase family 2 [Flavobacteriales bacterium]|nr:MAG: glycosyl transferase family 2 [Flavobacteriales bacterium]
MSKTEKKVSIIVPVFNEEQALPFFLTELQEFIFSKPNLSFELLFVNDGSTDNTVEILKKHEHIGYATKIILLSKNFGSHAASRAGLHYATGHYATFWAVDLQYPINLIDQLYHKCIEGADIVWAERESTKSGLFEKFFSHIYSLLMKKFVSNDYPEKGFDTVFFNRKVIDKLNQNVESNSSVLLQILTMGFQQASVCFEKQARTAGKSKWTLSKKIKLFIDSFVAFSYAPIRFVTIIGIAFFILGSMWTLYIVLRELIVGDLDPGWPALVAVLMVGFGVTNISLGIIAEYLWRTLDVSRKRPVFIIDEIIEAEADKLATEESFQKHEQQ